MDKTLPVVAIIISSVSALFTGINVVVGYRTYRRVHPKVKVRIFRRSVVTNRDGVKEYQYVLRFRNMGANPVSIERIELVKHVRWHRKDTLPLLKGERFLPGEGERVPPFDGITHGFSAPVRTVPMSGRCRFRVLLSNGRTAMSRKFHQSRLKPDD
ncbi:hypothetical protein [Streptomyces sp. NPDC008137]|uniref:hypothetical protein n=1 Tax=Streptomyces sp. NPDC008137 TaxID=3364813 RepID=UPI0036E3397B